MAQVLVLTNAPLSMLIIQSAFQGLSATILAMMTYLKAMELLGPRSLELEISHDDPVWGYLDSFWHTIAGGTAEVQRNIIGERVLGLPREPRPN